MEKEKRKIVRKEIWIDPKIVSHTYRHGSNHVEYYAYHDEKRFDSKDPYIPEPKDKILTGCKKTSICFGGILDWIRGSGSKDKKPFNRVLYHMTRDGNACIKLTNEEEQRWIELSIKYRFLPKYVTKDTLKDGKMVLDLTALSPRLLYVYLSQFRYFREDPGFVRSVIHLHDKHGMDFCAAFVLGSRVSVDYVVHHFLTLQRRYGGGGQNEVNSVIDIPFHTIAGLKRFVRNPTKYDDRSLYLNSCSFTCNTKIESISNIRYSLTAQELFEPLVIKAFTALTDKTAKKYLDEYKKIKPRIKYMEASK